MVGGAAEVSVCGVLDAVGGSGTGLVLEAAARAESVDGGITAAGVAGAAFRILNATFTD